MTTNGLPSAGWYADPQDAAQLRWWDGAAWTAHTAPVPQSAPVVAVAPQPAPVVAEQAPAVPQYGEIATPAVPQYGEIATPAVPQYGEIATPAVPQYGEQFPAAPTYAGAPAAAQQYAQQYAQPASQLYSAQPYSLAPQQPRVAEGTPTANWLIWVYTLLPLLSVLSLFAWDFEGYMRASLVDPLAAESMLLDPGYLLLNFGSWVIFAGMITLAVLDWRWLGQQGYQRRFHWAWAILSNLVYVIGRCVVVKRQAGSGFAPMWATIAISALSIVIAIVWFVQMMSTMMDIMMTTPGLVS